MHKQRTLTQCHQCRYNTSLKLNGLKWSQKSKTSCQFMHISIFNSTTKNYTNKKNNIKTKLTTICEKCARHQQSIARQQCQNQNNNNSCNWIRKLHTTVAHKQRERESEWDGETFNEPLHIVEALVATVSQRQLYTHFTRRLNVCLSLINKNTNKHEYGE